MMTKFCRQGFVWNFVGVVLMVPANICLRSELLHLFAVWASDTLSAVWDSANLLLKTLQENEKNHKSSKTKS